MHICCARARILYSLGLVLVVHVACGSGVRCAQLPLLALVIAAAYATVLIFPMQSNSQSLFHICPLILPTSSTVVLYWCLGLMLACIISMSARKSDGSSIREVSLTNLTNNLTNCTVPAGEQQAWPSICNSILCHMPYAIYIHMHASTIPASGWRQALLLPYF